MLISRLLLIQRCSSVQTVVGTSTGVLTALRAVVTFLLLLVTTVFTSTLQMVLSSSTQALTARLRILLRVVARSPSPRVP